MGAKKQLKTTFPIPLRSFLKTSLSMLQLCLPLILSLLTFLLSVLLFLLLLPPFLKSILHFFNWRCH
jgi:hypothetical protein